MVNAIQEDDLVQDRLDHMVKNKTDTQIRKHFLNHIRLAFNPAGVELPNIASDRKKFVTHSLKNPEIALSGAMVTLAA